MKLYKETGTNPFASCLPILLQMPIFLALFRLLDQASPRARPHGVMTDDATSSQFGDATIFGAPISTRSSTTGDHRRQGRSPPSWSSR